MHHHLPPSTPITTKHLSNPHLRAQRFLPTTKNFSPQRKGFSPQRKIPPQQRKFLPNNEKFLHNHENSSTTTKRYSLNPKCCSKQHKLLIYTNKKEAAWPLFIKNISRLDFQTMKITSHSSNIKEHKLNLQTMKITSHSSNIKEHKLNLQTMKSAAQLPDDYTLGWIHPHSVTLVDAECLIESLNVAQCTVYTPFAQ